MTKEEYISGGIAELFKYWLVQATAWGSVAFLSLSLLDYVSTPENFPLFLRYRIMIAVILIGVSLLSSRMQKRHILFHQILAYIAVFSSAVTIELMILRFGGHESPYYVGMILLCVMVVGFMPGYFYFYVAASLLIYAVYIIPLAILAPVVDARFSYIANGFMVTITSALLLIKYLSGNRLRTELGLTYDLEQHRKELQKTIEDRTSALTDAVSKLSAEIEERKRMDARMARLNEQLRHAQKMEAVGLLAGGIAHDFNTILTIIKGSGYLLKKRMKPDDPLFPYVEQILSSLRRGSDLTQHLMTFSRQQSIAPRPVDINHVVSQTADLLSRIAGKGTSVSFRPAEGPVMVMADSIQLEQVLMNLVANARDAMHGQGRIHVSTATVRFRKDDPQLPVGEAPGMYAVLSVSDSGLGMDDSLKGKIFDPFFTTKEFGTGSGLGLAIVYGIVKEHHGFISVESETGQGATFKVHIPLLGAGETGDRLVNTLSR